MAVRVRDFLRAHKTEGVGDGSAIAQFEVLVDRAEALTAQQRAGVVVTRAATMQRGELRRALQTKLLRYLAAVGAVAAKEARAMLEKATAQKPAGEPGDLGDAARRSGWRVEGVRADVGSDAGGP